jgi:hypothetical protein
MGSKVHGVDFQSDPWAMVFYFRGVKTVFFCEAATWAHFSIARDLRVVLGHRLRTIYHMPYVRTSYLEIHAASCCVPLNPLESDRI